MEDVIVIGAGVIGAFVARNLSRYRLRCLVIEKSLDVGDGSSMANSAIVHSGYDPIPGTKKAVCNVAGNAMYDEIASDLEVPFRRIGSLTVAEDEEGVKTLQSLLDRAKQNNVPARIVYQDELRSIEPAISKEALAALLCPTAGIVDPFLLVARAFENALDNGVKLRLGEEVTSIKRVDGIYEVATSKGRYLSKCVVNCAGLHSDEIANMVGSKGYRIIPKKGEYHVLDHFGPFVRHTLFPLPSKKGKGILITPTTSSNYLVGPSSDPIEEKEDVSTDSPTLSQVVEKAKSLVKELPLSERVRVFSGVRASIEGGDFIIEEDEGNPGFINLVGIDSPGLASAPYIGKIAVEELLSRRIKLVENPSYNPKVRHYVRPSLLSLSERNALIEANPDYGRIVCTCEKVSLAELEDILSRSLPCLTIKAMKKRSRAGFGKCQGGFCQAKVLMLLSKKLGIKPEEVLYDGPNSNILMEESK